MSKKLEEKLKNRSNGIMMQYFHWYLPDNGKLWKDLINDAPKLAKKGITGIWLPPAYKGFAGMKDVGYGAYDVYDLGEFYQKNTISTKYGEKKDYLAAIKALQSVGIEVYGDIVLNHKMGADELEDVEAIETNCNDRNQCVSEKKVISAATKFTFPGRKNKYSDFKWDHRDFNGVDYDNKEKKSGIYNFVGTPWDGEVDNENANYDYLMGADICFSNPDVTNELDKWGQWYFDITGVDGFRLDAIKHIKFTFFRDWLKKLRENNKKELFTVGEYWSADLGKLVHYLDVCEQSLSLFDVPLHFNFYNASRTNGAYNMGDLFSNTLVGKDPTKAVTFVDNHDTQAGQSLETEVEYWFKPLAYAAILLRPYGYPCVFYGDYYGVGEPKKPPLKKILDILFKVRKEKVFGEIHDYFDHNDIVGWTLSGDSEHTDSGVAVIITNGLGGQKQMYMGDTHKGKVFIDITDNRKDKIVISEDGMGVFPVDDGSFSVWIHKPY